MTQRVEIRDHDANSVLDIVQQLRTQGLRQGQDFDFAFHQSRWDPMIGDVPAFAVFEFYTEKYATLFAIKYL